MNAAIDHNNRGIECLMKGENELALIQFKRAAQLMHAASKEMKRTEHREHSTIGSYSQTMCKIESSNNFIRSTPIVMSHEHEVSDTCTIESAIILLNMALCYHLDSIKAQPMSSALKNAITLYEMSYSLGVQVRDDPRAHQLILTSINNLAEISYELGDFESSRTLMEDLGTFVAFLVDSNQGTEVLDRKDLILNAMVLANPNIGAAAA